MNPRPPFTTKFDFQEDSMNSPITPSFDSDFDLEWDENYIPISPNCLTLSQTQIDRAVTASQHIQDPEKNWAVYLSQLALSGFEQWLERQVTPDITLDRHKVQILEPAHSGAPTTVQNLSANGFKLCLITTSGQPDDYIDIPQNAIVPPFAHFYIVIIIHEELRQVQVREFLSGDALQTLQQKSPFSLNRDGTYAIPAECFNPDLDRLLLNLSCLQPTAPQKTVINLSRWFEQEVRDWVEDLVEGLEAITWTLIPTWQVASAMRGDTTSLRPIRKAANQVTRSPQEGAEGFLPIFKSLTQQGIHLSPNSRAAYQTLQLGNHSLQLCVLAALLPSSNNVPQWSLMAILKPQRDRLLPDGIYLRISDPGTMLVEQGTQASKPVGSLFIRAIGEGHEELTVTVSYTDPQNGSSQISQSVFTIDEV
jgi:hypothetical protein